jgi:hypothetical protein
MKSLTLPKLKYVRNAAPEWPFSRVAFPAPPAVIPTADFADIY